MTTNWTVSVNDDDHIIVEEIAEHAINPRRPQVFTSVGNAISFLAGTLAMELSALAETFVLWISEPVTGSQLMEGGEKIWK